MKIIKRLSEPKFITLFALCWTGLVFYLCLTESSSLPKFNFEFKDKIIHFLFYFIFVKLWYNSQIKAIKGINHLMYIVLLAIAIGVLIELLQKEFTKTRTFDWLDIIANTLGAISCYLFIKLFFQTKKDN